MNFSITGDRLYNRLIKIDNSASRTFFLWGARQSGKSTLLHHRFADAIWIDLLKSDQFARYVTHPNLLREELEAHDAQRFVVIDEVQKVPVLLNEVHWLIENQGIKFALCGSSTRKLKRGHGNLLGGRALRYELFGLTAAELGNDFNLTQMLNRGYIPNHYMAADSEIKRLFLSYIADYLKDEIAGEALVRDIPAFSNFLAKAALSDTEVVSYSSFARDVGVAVNTIKEYFSILEDTLIGWFVPAFQKRPKRRTTLSPKFYFGDVGIVNALAKRGTLSLGNELFGKSFENWIAHELRSYNQYEDRLEPISYWQLTTGVEVDFIIGGDAPVAIEAKSTTQVNSDHLKGLRQFKVEYPNVKRLIVVSLDSHRRKLDDGIEILPYQEFIQELWQGSLF